jgi:dCTP deaminase
MSILGRTAIITAMRHRIPSRRLYITPLLDATQIGDASVDVRLGNEFLTTQRGNIGVLDPGDKGQRPDRFLHRHRLNRGDPFYLHPNEVALAATLEYFRLPRNLSAYVTSRSKWGRVGLIIATATAVHPGWKGVLTLELVNHNNVPLTLYPGLTVAQVILHETVDATEYAGDLKEKTTPHPSDMTTYWQKDMSFWAPCGTPLASPDVASRHTGGADRKQRRRIA